MTGIKTFANSLGHTRPWNYEPTASAMSSLSLIPQVYNHLVLPPKLPGKQDEVPHLVHTNLTSRVLHAVQQMRNRTDTEPIWENLEESLKRCRDCHEDEQLRKSSCIKAFQALPRQQNAVILYIKEQNAGLLIRSQSEDEETSVVFETFEAASTSEAALAAKGAIRREFPGQAIKIPLSTYEQESFQDVLALFLEQASVEHLENFGAKSHKAGISIVETRDTANPGIITEFLTTVLEANGSQIHPPVLVKRVKDDVCWSNSELPWRRSPFWLVLRTSIQRLLYLGEGEAYGRAYYKFLMCLVFANLLEDSIDTVDLELCDILRAKLCRRLAKLEVEKASSDERARELYGQLFEDIGLICRGSIERTTKQIEETWEAFRRRTIRQIPSLRSYARDGDLHLTLPNSGPQLQEILDQSFTGGYPWKQTANTESLISHGQTINKEYDSLASRVQSFTELELAIEHASRTDDSIQMQNLGQCEAVASQIDEYLPTAIELLESNPDQLSISILNIFELWMRMDKLAVAAYPLLKDYHPYFHPNLLDVLLLPRKEELRRLRKIQLYLDSRCRRCLTQSMNIFSEPVKGCFADRFMEAAETNEFQYLRALETRIENNSRIDKAEKERELHRVNAEYSNLTEKIQTSHCCCTWNADGSRNVRGCTHCFHLRRRRKIKITVHEDLLPSDSEKHKAQRHAIVFELGIPTQFSIYRDTTWRIITTLSKHIEKRNSDPPHALIRNYSKLQNFARSADTSLTLGSRSKSFRDTHFKSHQLPASAKQVLLPFALKLSYYDKSSKTWPMNLSGLFSLVWHCSVNLPKGSVFSNLYSSSEFAADSNGPSSYEAIASQTKCPKEVTAQEFTAHQTLIAGKSRRWISILIELGSSNINFSLEESMVLFNYLALQAGPRDEDDHFGKVHQIFRDPEFCFRLIERIEERVEIIAPNWRESNYMELLLTLTLRVFEYGPKDAIKCAKELLEKIRSVTLEWTCRLREEARIAETLEKAELASRFAFLAALLCRRTYEVYTLQEEAMTSSAFQSFIEATIAMQENLIVGLARFSTMTRNRVVRDIKTTFKLHSQLTQLVSQYSTNLERALTTVWKDLANLPRQYSAWQILAPPYHGWITATVKATDHTNSQLVQYHLLHGYLLVNGKGLGRLPADIRDHPAVRTLFGNRQLTALSSSMPGMVYVLANYMEGHEIHLGYRNDSIIIRARTATSRLEFIDPVIFGNELNLDLPYPLVHDYVHWFDLYTGTIEFRKKPQIWKPERLGNWILNFYSRRAYKRRDRPTKLINPSSQIARLVCSIFNHFELPQMIIITQGSNGRVHVHLKRMDLQFFINQRNLLESVQLKVEVDPNQDTGTFYGLQSMLVLREVADATRRSIIVPTGQIRYKRDAPHVSVHVENHGLYARYIINEILGRLDCPPEPRLLYMKAQLHAFTSFFLPDSLTGQTGTEEALSCLQSGYCQPWTRLDKHLISVLEMLSQLSVRRNYYPRGVERQQTVQWNPELTVTIQHDAYVSAINAIISKSQRLCQFEAEPPKITLAEDLRVYHLTERALWRRSLYERSGAFRSPCSEPVDLTYTARDRLHNKSRKTRLREILSLLKNQPPKFHTSRNLVDVLKQWSVIGGFVSRTSSFLLVDFIQTDMSQHWGSLVRLCKESGPENVHRVMFELGLIAFGDGPHMEALRTVTSFYFCEALKQLRLPQCDSFNNFTPNEVPQSDRLIENITSSKLTFASIGVKKRFKTLPNDPWPIETLTCAQQERYRDECSQLVEYLVKQWPCPEPTSNNKSSTELIVPRALEVIMPEWSRLYNNLELSDFIRDTQRILDSRYIAKAKFQEQENLPFIEYFRTFPRQAKVIPSLAADLLGKPVPQEAQRTLPDMTGALAIRPKDVGNTTHSPSHIASGPRNFAVAPDLTELVTIVEKLTTSNCAVRLQYAQDLGRSIQALKKEKLRPRKAEVMLAPSMALEISGARAMVKRSFDEIHDALVADDERVQWLKIGNLWPCITFETILKELKASAQNTMSTSMKDAILIFACSLAKLQRLLRIEEAKKKCNSTKLQYELENDSHTNWSPREFPDWLLMEIDANITIREDQVTVALETISPTSKSNSVLQMTMGRGKTSVIMPMVAAVLADRKNLTRLLVPKALLVQTAQVLQSKIGGLLGREVTHVPFARRTVTSPGIVQQYQSLHQDMLQKAGIILESPDHLLSFKLSGLQFVSDSKILDASKMINVQKWMDDVCRDIVDESDLALSVKTQLIYPSGTQSTVDGHSNRWKTIQDVLSLVKSHLPTIAEQYPGSVDLVSQNRRAFPVAHILRYEAEEALRYRIVKEILSGKTERLPMRDYTEIDHEAIRRFVTEEDVPQQISEHMSELFQGDIAVKKNLFLLRGLLAYRILILCLKKRWNVQYGLHPMRDPIAVPFHAKGIPSDESEWGHPDVAITFTCLAFYYTGLNLDRMKQTLQGVLRSDDPSSEYDRLINSVPELPTSLQHWNVINVDDLGQLQEIWSYLRFSVPVINYFLNKFVFPLHAKQFSVKLQTSGWDIPLPQSPAQPQTEREHVEVDPKKVICGSGLTTGFSGTNDNRRLLPLTIEQRDLPELSHTNAEVLTTLLQSRNRQYIKATNPDGTRLSEMGLLRHLAERNIRILIDSGAYVLEMDNENLVTNWLIVDPSAQAAVFFRNDSSAYVRYQSGKTLPLLATPFVDDLSDCLVYLDEAHTRGTDLKFPPAAKGALTLCLNQTKDHTVQAAMRLRQLGTTQSVVFISPPEVHQSILDVCGQKSNQYLNSSHVVTWLLEQTCANIKDLQPLYFAQRDDFNDRMQASKDHKGFLENRSDRTDYLKVLQKPERMTLEQLYNPESNHVRGGSESNDSVFVEVQTINETETNQSSLRSSALEEVEQQREVSHEVEEQRQNQKRVEFKALKFPGLHPSIRNFASSGVLEGREGYTSASEAFEMTQIRQKYMILPSQLLSNLHVSREFLRTIEHQQKGRQRGAVDHFVRPLNWILLNRTTHTAIAVIPEEAEILIPIVRKAQAPTMHLVTYAAPVTRQMTHFSGLKYYSIPTLPSSWEPQAWLPIELGLLAGRLYFQYSELNDVSSHLGLVASCTSINDQTRPNRTNQTLLFLQEWLSIRRNGQDVIHTPMGYICQGWKLRPDHPFFYMTSKTGKELPIHHEASGSSSLGQDSQVLYEYDSADDEHEPVGEEEDVAGLDSLAKMNL